MKSAVESEGLFAIWQQRYAALGLPTFPVNGQTKKPQISGYLRLGLAGSAKLTAKFAHSSALGIPLGRRTGICVLDVDTSDESFLNHAIARYGDTPFLVRSGRGRFHAWYKHNGERRHIRPFPGFPIDILGAGFVLAPPSVAQSGSYEIIRGSLDDLRRLPPMRGSSATERLGVSLSAKRINEGSRNNTLFRYALDQARYVDDEQTLLDVVETENARGCVTELSHNEIAKIVGSAWKYQVTGRNLIAGNFIRANIEEVEELAGPHPDAFALLMILRRFHNDYNGFALGKAMARKLAWSLPRFRAARHVLETRRHIQCLHPGGRGKNDPPRYALRGAISRPNINNTFSPRIHLDV